ncbi:amidohydrolase family protein [Luteibaculum oceani]|uniref:Amidohydrolase family protein n=1 Tax=Luteibaculum oceani TaxID=1294296 RepID=A0A5C6V026_9FLAO|nr:amidohydrolase family protein [Luteibaculum oceani]
MKKLLSLSILLGASISLLAQQTLISNATLHLGNGEIIENGFIGLGSNGEIDYLGVSAPLNAYKEEIDATGKHVYPGFIVPNTTLGLVEISAVRASRDHAETGSFNPNVRSLIAFNCESDIIPTAMDNGVLIGQITPRSGRISGSSSVVNLDCWNWEDAALKTDDGIHVNWPAPSYRTGWWAEPGGIKLNEKYDEQVIELSDYLKNAKAYNASTSNLKDLRYVALGGLFKGSKTLYIHTNSAHAMLDALELKKQLGIEKLVFVGGYESHLILDELKTAQTPIILRRLHELPMHPDDPLHLPYQLPAILNRAGITVALDVAGDMEQIQVRNLPFLAGTAAAYGVSTEDAVKMITLNTAIALGIDDKVGTLQKGKHATLFVSEGNALEPMTNNVIMAFVKGKPVDLNDNKQKQLYKKYQGKYNQ